MVLPLLDSPFLSVTQYGECVTGPSRDKKRENLNFTFSKCPPVSFYLILAFSSCLCGGFAVLLSPLQCSACLPSACPGVTISWGSATRKASLQAGGWPRLVVLHALQCCGSVQLLLPQASWGGKYWVHWLRSLA